MDDINTSEPQGLDEYIAKLSGSTESDEPAGLDDYIQSLSPKVDAKAMPQGEPEGLDEYVQELREEKYGSLGQQGIAAVEGLSQGIAGPLATLAETELLGVLKEDILARQEVNPITHMGGEAVGLVGGLLTGVGEGALLAKTGQAAAKVAGLGALGQEARLIHRIGSEAVKQAAEMAVYTAGSETSKMILQDPNTSAESAIANVGLGAALGGVGGAFITGAISPLWKATAGPKVEGLLSGLKNHIDGVAMVLPEEAEQAIRKLGIEVTPEIRAVLSKNPSAVERFNVLKEVQNKTILEGIEKLNKDASESVIKSLGIDPIDIQVYSENEAGHTLLETFKKEYKERYEPIAARLKARDEAASGISVLDEDKLKLYGNLIEDGMNKWGTDSPLYKEYANWGNRILAKDTIGALDKLKTEINGEIKKAFADPNMKIALGDIKRSIADFQEKQIIRNEILKQESKGAGRVAFDWENPEKAAADLINSRAEVNRQYSEFASLSDDLTNHLGVGDFRGAGALSTKLTEKLSPEQVLNKFSIRNNADFIEFLAKNFPETMKEVQKNELKRILKPAVLSAKGEAPLNVKKLDDIITKAMAGQKELIDAVMPAESVDTIKSARLLMDAIPSPKSSGTAGWMTKVMNKMPQSAMAAIAMITGNNPVFGYLVGEMAQRLGRHAPDAINLAYLRWLESSQPVKSEGFKAMVEFMNHTYKGQNNINKAIKSVFKSGAQVLAGNMLPSDKDLDKLDEKIGEMQDAPTQIYALQDGEVGYYMPEHQTSLSMTTTRALEYLQTLKPHNESTMPLDSDIKPSKESVARYRKALEIAQQPAIILKKIKDGTLSHTDIEDLGAMYPGLYKSMADKLSDEMIHAKANNELIPYKTKVSLSLFLGQPLDTSMNQMSILAIQNTFGPKQEPQMNVAKGSSKMGKNNDMYQTPLQSSQARRINNK